MTRSTVCCAHAPAAQHRILTFEEHYLKHGPGYRILKARAQAMYPQLKRQADVRLNDGWVAKDQVSRDVQSCSQCGCTDYHGDSLGSSEAGFLCICKHAKGTHTLPYPDGPDQMREFYILLAIVVDFLYQGRETCDIILVGEELRRVREESILQI